MINRRHALGTMAATAVSVTIRPSFASQAVAAESVAQSPTPAWKLIDHQTISRPVDRYYGWPTLAKRRDGQLIVVASGGRQRHVCPFGRVDMIQSLDGGESWTFARTICDGPIDDRDAGIVETQAGTLLVTTFSSLAYEPILQEAIASETSRTPTMNAEDLTAWKAAHGRLADGEHTHHLGNWMLRSEDSGLTWSAPYRVPLNSPHGPVVLSDGRLLYAGKALWTDNNRVGVCVSTDDGRSWQWLADIPARDGDDQQQYHELHAVEASSGRLVVHIRNHNPPDSGHTLQSHSDDGGQTWSVPRNIDVWGLPSHLLRLQDGRLLMSYGHRRAPLGIQIRISNDNAETWSEPIILHGAASSGDLGYPSTVQQSDGTLCTVWYEHLSDNPRCQLQAARWELV